MVTEVVSFLGGRGTVVDMTLGAGGHTEALLDAGVDRVIGIDVILPPWRSRASACRGSGERFPADRTDHVLRRR